MEEPTGRVPGSGAQFAAMAFTVLSLLYLSLKFFLAWGNPLGERNLPWVANAGVIIVLEFFLMHAGMFAANMFTGGIHWRTLPGMLLFLSFYGMFIVGFGFAFSRFWIAASMGILLAGRLATVVLAPPGSRGLVRARALLSALSYMACFALGMLLPAWSKQTTAALAKLLAVKLHMIEFYDAGVRAGALYFLVLALIELVLYFRPPRPDSSLST